MPSIMYKSKIVQQLSELNVIEKLNIITDMWDEIKESRELEFVSDEKKDSSWTDWQITDQILVLLKIGQI